MTDSSIPDVPAFADALSPLERAKLSLQDELSVFEIGLVTYPEKDAYLDRERLTKFLLQAIKAGWLAAYGNPDGWYARVSRPNQQPLSMRIRNRDLIINRPPIANGEQWERCNPHEGTRKVRGIWRGFHAIFDDMDFHGNNCLVQRADYLAFLEKPVAHGIPKPDQWKAPQGEQAAQPETSAAKQEQLPLAKREPRAFTSPISSDLPRTHNAQPIGLTSDYQRYQRLETYPNQDALKWQAREGRLRVAIETCRLRASLVVGNPDSNDGTLPRDSPLLLVEGFWYLDWEQAFFVLRDGEYRAITWLYPPNPVELHCRWPDLFPESEFYLKLEDFLPVRRADLFWLDVPSQPETKPIEPAPIIQSEPDKPEQGAAAKHETELQMHKRECQEIGKRLWGENPNSTKTEIMKHPEMLFYVQAYKGKNTISGWLAVIDPRPKDKRRGRPKKIPV